MRASEYASSKSVLSHRQRFKNIAFFVSIDFKVTYINPASAVQNAMIKKSFVASVLA